MGVVQLNITVLCLVSLLFFFLCLFFPLSIAIMSEKKAPDEPLTPTQSYAGDGQVADTQHDAVFGEITGEGPNYRSVRLPHPPYYTTPAHHPRSDGWEHPSS